MALVTFPETVDAVSQVLASDERWISSAVAVLAGLVMVRRTVVASCRAAAMAVGAAGVL